MLVTLVYPWINLVVWTAFLVFLTILLVRLIYSYADPNPFGRIGRFGYQIRKLTEKWVYPSARFLANFRIDTRLAPILTILIGLVITYFGMSIIYETFRVIDKFGELTVTGNLKGFVGLIIYSMLDLFVLFIFIRFISSWFVFHRKTFFGFDKRVTDPIMVRAQRIIPTVGMFDISALIVLILISFLQMIVVNAFGL
ncbi:MAG TPA: YggT family protein [Pyrinomonadaceae bacterium]|nr:YggT family protein [Pyrinomonadaceae bacterium]